MTSSPLSAPPPSSVARTHPLARAFAYRETWVALAVLLFIALGSALRPDFFPSLNNFSNILREVAQIGILAVGVSFVLINGDIDLSVGSIYGLSTLVFALAVYFGGWNPWLAALAALASGTVAGLVNGFLVTTLRLPAFIVTLSTLFIGRGLCLAGSGGSSIPITGGSDGFYVLGQTGFLGLNNQVWVMLGVLAVLGVALWRSPFGYRTYASGGNRNAATVAGINTNRVRLTAFVISGTCAALAGLLGMAFTPSFSPTAGQGLELDAVAAVVVGGISLFGGRGSALGAVLGAMFLVVIRKILTIGILLPGGDLWRLPQTATPIFIGSFILLAVILDVWVREEQALARLLARLRGQVFPARPSGTASETLGTKGRAAESLPRPGWRGALERVLGSREFGGLVIFGLVFALGTFLRPDFFPSAANLETALREQVLQICLIGLAMTLVIINGDIDLSVGSVLSLSGAVWAVLLQRGTNAWLAALIALAVCAVVGFINGFLSTRGKLPSFIVTLGMLQLAKGAAASIAGGSQLTNFPESGFFNFFGSSGWGQPLLLAVLFVIFGVLLWRGLWGYQHYAVGGNRRASTLAGLNVDAVRLRAFVLSSLMAGLAGILSVAKNSSYAPLVGEGQELFVISAVIVGGTSLLGGRGSVLGTLIGALILGFITNLLTIPVTIGGELTTLPQTWLQIIFGSVLLLAVIADIWLREERILAVWFSRGRR